MRVLVLGPSGAEAALTLGRLSRAGLAAEPCDCSPELLPKLADGAGAVLLAEDALQADDLRHLMEWLAAQPVWSDLPLILLLRPGRAAGQPSRVRYLLQGSTNLTVLERPCSSATLVTAVRAALRARDRQYDMRDGMAALASTEDRMRRLIDANARLQAEIADRERAHAQLHQSQKLEAVGQLTSGVAHDFNNLLTAIIGNLEMAQARARDDRVGRLLDAAVRAAERGAKLTQHLLAFSRKQHLAPKPVDLNALITEAQHALAGTVGAPITVDSLPAAGLWPALVDADQISLVLFNLAMNGRDAMPQGGRLTLRTENVARSAVPAGLSNGEYVLLAVSDTGMGMTEDVLSRALEPFFTTKPIGHGSGLGLSMAHGVAIQSGGGLRIASEPGRGTTVFVYLPRAVVTGPNRHGRP
jgi:signal transduction histidine kinase